MEALQSVALVVLAVLGGLIAILAAVAPLTKSTLDNKVLDALRFVRDLLVKLVGGSVPKPE